MKFLLISFISLFLLSSCEQKIKLPTAPKVSQNKIQEILQEEPKEKELQRVYVKNGRFVYEDGSDVRLWGVNYQVSLNYCMNRFVKAGILDWNEFDSPKYYRIIDEGLDEIQKLGCDVVRVHLSPHELANFDGSLKQSDNLKILEYLMAECRKRKLYYYFAFLNHLGATNKNAWGTLLEDPDGGVLDQTEWFSDQSFIKRSQNYIKNMLFKENQFDSVRMIDDPAFCLIELVNEPETPHEDKAGTKYHKVYSKWLKKQGKKNNDKNFQLWRRDMVKDYLNSMCNFIEGIGCKTPVGWSHKWVQAMKHAGSDAEWQASLLSKIPSVSFSTYPTQSVVYDYVHDPKKDLRKMDKVTNSLPYLNEAYNSRIHQGWANSSEFRKKAHFIYEWELHATMTSYMYPAMAKYFRAQGAQIATMWTYIPPRLINYAAAQHMLSLKGTPAKSASFIAAGKIFRDTPLYQRFSTSSEDADYFKNTALDFKYLTSAYADDQSLIYSGDMPEAYANHLLTSHKVSKGFEEIVGLGSSPLVKYYGSGLYFIDRSNQDAITIEIMPDTEWVRSPVTGGKLLDKNGKAPKNDDPPYSSNKEYYSNMSKYRRKLSNKFTFHKEHVMELDFDLPENAQVYRIERNREVRVRSEKNSPLKFMAKPGKYVIR